MDPMCVPSSLLSLQTKKEIVAFFDNSGVYVRERSLKEPCLFSNYADTIGKVKDSP